MRLHLHTNEASDRAAAAKSEVARLARARGLELCADGAVSDIVVALGGDGTILRAVHHHPGIPVLGFNLGSLGYLATVEEGGFEDALDKLASGNWTVSRRTMLEVVKPSTGERAVALNEIAAMRELTGHAAWIDLETGGRAVTRYAADGLVIATPTGSTAYSLAAGGPILMPDTSALVVTPMNPHALGVRAFVANDGMYFKLTSRRRVNGRGERLGVYADGDGVFMLECDEAIVVSKARESACLVELPGYDPFAVLSRKLGWPV